MTGGVVSTTVTTVPQEAVLVALSVTVTATLFVPSGRLALNITGVVVPGLPAGIVLVWALVPLTLQTTFSASPSGSETTTVIVAVVPHSTVASGPQVMVGGTLTSATSWPRISPSGFAAV